MIEQSFIDIRGFQSQDKEDVRRISYETAFLGNPASVFFDDAGILKDALTLYFTDYEPESSFVAVKDSKVIGYIIGAKDVSREKRIFMFKILPELLIKSIKRGTFLKKKARTFLLRCILSFLKGEFFVPDFSREYPATLHINVDKDFRGLHIGEKLLDYYLDYLKENNIPGVHLSTTSHDAKAFFEKTGFKELFKRRRTYLRSLLDKDVYYYLLGLIL